jgi:hypothetical protein
VGDGIFASFSESLINGRLQPWYLKEQQARAIRADFAVLDRHIHLRDFGNAQITQGAGGCVDGVLRGIVPGFRARADYFDNAID